MTQIDPNSLTAPEVIEWAQRPSTTEDEKAHALDVETGADGKNRKTVVEALSPQAPTTDGPGGEDDNGEPVSEFATEDATVEGTPFDAKDSTALREGQGAPFDVFLRFNDDGVTRELRSTLGPGERGLHIVMKGVEVTAGALAQVRAYTGQ